MITNEAVLEPKVLCTENSTLKKQRQSNFELLRIISMFLIIAHHYVLHSDLLNMGIVPNKIVADFLVIGGKVGVNCFILISAYFLVDSEFKIKRLLKLILQTLFYSIIFLVLFSAFNIIDISQINKTAFIFPIIFSTYWFVTAYIGLYVLSPFLSRIIHSFDKKILSKLIIIMTLLLTSFSNIFMTNPFFSDLIWFIYLYFIASYCKYYFADKKITTISHLIIAIIAYISVYVLSISFSMLGTNIEILAPYYRYIISINTFPILICSLALFLFFKNIRIKTSKFINLIASTSLGIYLIHDNIFVRNYLWHKIWKVNTYIEIPILQFIFKSIIAVLFTFIICLLIELMRMYFIEKNIFKLKFLDRYFNKIDNWINN